MNKKTVLALTLSLAIGCTFTTAVYADSIDYKGDPSILKADPFDPTDPAKKALYPNATSGNSVTIDVSSGAMPNTIFGAYTSTAANVIGNTVNIVNTYSTGDIADVYGGVATDGSANGNVVNMNGGVISQIVGGRSEGADATGNKVNITGGTVSTIYGGEANSLGSASGNTITISEGRVEGNIYGGTTIGGNAINNIVTVNGSAQVADTIEIYGGNRVSPGGDVSSGNTLNWGIKGKVAKVANFEYYNFTIPAGTQAGDVLLEITDKAFFNNTSFKIKALAGDQHWTAGSTITLVNMPNGWQGGVIVDGNGKLASGLRAYEYQYDLTGGANSASSVVATIGKVGGATGDLVGTHAKSLSEGRIASLAFINAAADLAVGSGLQSALDSSGEKYDLFGTINYSDSKLATGASTDLKGTSLLMGISRKLSIQGADWLWAAFLESGWGTYDTHQRFADIDSVVYANGKSNYFGGGLLARSMRDNGIYLEGSLRIGRTSTDYDSQDLGSKYDIKSTYYGLHLGLGKIFKTGRKTELDVYGKYFLTHQNSANAVIKGDTINFDSLDSNRLRIGARLNMLGGGHGLKTYVGIAYEHEFSASAGSYALGTDIAAPCIKGGTGIGEIGLVYKPAGRATFSMDLGLNGYVGKRKGFSGNMNLNWSF